MDIRQLRYFVTAVDVGSVTNAAHRLNISQPALGLQIRKLEGEFGSSLLTRHSRGVTPTIAGEKLYEVDIVSGTAKLVAADFVDVTMPRWLADGDRWVAGCRNAAGWGICLGNAENVTRIADGYYRPRPYTNRDVAVVDNEGNLYSLAVTDGSRKELWDGLPGNGRYGWVVDGNQLYFLTGGETGNAGRLNRRHLGSGDTEVLYSGAMPLADTNISIGRQTGTVLFTRFADSSDDLVVFEGVDLD